MRVNGKTTGLIHVKLILLIGFVLAFIIAVNLVRNPNLALLLLSTAFFIATVQYHHDLGVLVPIVFFYSAFVVGFLPGRPFFWEIAPLLGISGVASTLLLHRQSVNYAMRRRGTILGLVGVIGYCAVLVFIMYHRGFGMRVLGDHTYGGRAYVKQIACAFFPFVFLFRVLERKVYLRLLIIGQALTVTYLITDVLLQFQWFEVLRRVVVLLEFSTDSFNFFGRGLRGELQRFQSFGHVSSGILMILFIYKKPSDLLRQPWVNAVMIASLFLGALSGHRSLVARQIFLVFFWLWVHKLYQNLMLLLAGSFVLAILIAGLYMNTTRLPGALQRSFEFMPGLTIDPAVKRDASGTMAMRRNLRQIGWRMIPQYFWIGAGFSYPPITYVTDMLDPTGLTSHLQRRVFYNGFIGLMVNTGFPGTFFMVIFLLGGSLNALYLIRRYMRVPVHDPFMRASAIFSGLWFFNVVFFLFLHGNSEWAMKTFAYEFSMLLVFVHFDMKRNQEMPADSTRVTSGVS